MKPYDFKWTRFYEDGEAAGELFQGIEIGLSDNELVICSTMIDEDNFSILTTRKLVTKENGIVVSGDMSMASHGDYGDFKGLRSRLPFISGSVQLENGDELRYFIETGKPSMVMIYGIKTILQVQGMTGMQVDKVGRIWTKRSTDEA